MLVLVDVKKERLSQNYVNPKFLRKILAGQDLLLNLFNPLASCYKLAKLLPNMNPLNAVARLPAAAAAAAAAAPSPKKKEEKKIEQQTPAGGVLFPRNPSS